MTNFKADPHMVDHLYGVSKSTDYDAKAKVALIRGDCVRSGGCCLSAPCPVAIEDGHTRGRCPWLIGDTSGFYSCQKVLAGDPRMAVVGVGMGCARPRGIDRITAGANQTKVRKGEKL